MGIAASIHIARLPEHFKPWWCEVEHATSRLQKLPTVFSPEARSPKHSFVQHPPPPPHTHTHIGFDS